MSSYTRYWDLPELERGRLTHEQVQSFIDVHLMENGLLRPVEPEYLPVPDTPDMGEKVNLYKIKMGYSDICYVRSIEDVGKFLAIQPVKVESEYMRNGPNIPFIGTDKTPDISSEPVEVYTANGVNLAKATLKKIEEIKSANEASRKAYSESCKAIEDAASGVWEDWGACREKIQYYNRLIATWEQFLKMACGSKDAAANFLRLAIDKDRDLSDLLLDSTEEAKNALVRTAFLAADKPIPLPFTLVICDEPCAVE